MISLPELTYIVEESTDLTNWFTASTVDEMGSPSGSTAIVKAKVDITGLSSLFLRLRTTQQ